MRIAFVSTYLPAHCGIATYTHYLCSALLDASPEVKISVIAEEGARECLDDRFESIPSFTRTGDYARDISLAVEKIDPELVHIQHEFGIFGVDHRFIDLLRSLSDLRKLTVVTLHTVHTQRDARMRFKDPPYNISPKDIDIEAYNRRIGELSAKLLVHLNSGREVLIRQGVPAGKIETVRHGTRLMEAIDERVTKRMYGFPEEAKVLLAFGFIRSVKGIDALIDALPSVVEKVPQARLFIVGDSQFSSEEDLDYIRLLEGRINSLGLGDRVTFARSFIEEEEVPKVFSCADLVVYPHVHPYRSASGSFHLGIGAKKPVVVSHIPKFKEEVMEISKELIYQPDGKNLAKLITKLLADEELRSRIREKIEKYAEQTSWEQTAKRHLAIYRSILGRT
jgi:glycosyltransferase involved in cell wall biosynthesis